MLFHQLCLVLFASSVFCSTIPVVWLVLFKRKKKKRKDRLGMVLGPLLCMVILQEQLLTWLDDCERQ